jgi:hypothetical protein
MYDISNFDSIRKYRIDIPTSENLLTHEYLNQNIRLVINDLNFISLIDTCNNDILNELLKTLYMLSFKIDISSKVVINLQKTANLNVYEILKNILSKSTKFINLIFSILSNLTGDIYSTCCEENNKFFIDYLFSYLQNYDLSSTSNSKETIELIDKFIGFLFVNHRLYDIPLNNTSVDILISLKSYVESVMANYKRKNKHFEIIRMNVLSILFDYLNRNEVHPEYIADYIIVLVDLIKKIINDSKKNKELSDDTVFYLSYQSKDTVTYIYCLDLLERLKKVIGNIEIDQLKEIIFEENLLPEIIKIISTGNSSETSECCYLLLKLIENENVKNYLVCNKARLVNENCNVKSLKILLSQL